MRSAVAEAAAADESCAFHLLHVSVVVIQHRAFGASRHAPVRGGMKYSRRGVSALPWELQARAGRVGCPHRGHTALRHGTTASGKLQRRGAGWFVSAM